MSYLLPHLRTGWAVDQAILNEEERVVCLRFGHDHDVTCMQMDEVLAGVAETVKNFCAIYVVDVSEVSFYFRCCTCYAVQSTVVVLARSNAPQIALKMPRRVQRLNHISVWEHRDAVVFE